MKLISEMTRVLRASDFDIGSAAEIFGTDLELIRIGAPQGADDQHGAYDWWPLSIRGNPIGELRADAYGMMIHLSDDY